MKSVRYAVRTYLIKDDKVLTITYNSGNQEGWFDIPGGKIEDGETPEDAAIREMKEETGVVISNPKQCGKIIVEYPDRIYDFVIFLVNEYKGEIENCEDNNPRFIDINELKDNEKSLPSAKILKDIYLLLGEEDFEFRMQVDDNNRIIDITRKL